MTQMLSPSHSHAITQALPTSQLTTLEGWAMVQRAPSYVSYPTSVEDVAGLLQIARQGGRSIAPRGTGNSYNDAALNREDMVLDFSQMARILDWNPDAGIITVEPGATIRDVWRTAIADGWWLPVTPGTMIPTIAGCLAMNVHGKNAWHAGSFGEHVLAFEMMFPGGTLRMLTLKNDPDLFHAAIGGLGMLGIVTSITLQLRRIVSGTLRTRRYGAPNLKAMFDLFDRETISADYLVGWIDGFADGASLGRGLVERGDFEDTPDTSVLEPAKQDLPPTIAGFIPRSELWRVMNPAFNDPTMRFINTMQYTMGSRGQGQAHRVPHAQFHYLHDYIPNWRKSWLPGGLRQFQVFVPTANAPTVFAELLQRAHRANLNPYLCVFKRHRTDPFLLAYQVDGYSLSLDFRVTEARRQRLDQTLQQLRDVVLSGGGRFYLAKDDLLNAEQYRQSVGAEAYDRFRAIKRDLDPGEVLQSNLYRRVFK